MAERRVSVKLQADIAQYKSAMMEAAASTKTLGDVADKESDRMRKIGETHGGLLAQGVKTGIMRNSPAIVAGIGAALAVGGPAMLAGAGVLFAGLGAAAAAQTEQVRQSWMELGSDIKAGAAEDAASLVPIFAGAADKIGASYERLRPEIRDAFEASGPVIDDFVDSLTNAAENAMPGLLHAVEQGGPVFDGLGSLVEDVGTGISDFFDTIAEHGPSAGQAFSALGDVIGEALPLLGELLGSGAELATVVLPPFAVALGAVADAAEDLGPLLPALTLGFAGLRVADRLSSSLGSVADRLDGVASRGGAAAGAAGKASGALSALGGALPIVGLGVAAFAAGMSNAEREAREWAQALLDGGAAAREAMESAGQNDVLEGATQGFPLLSAAVGLFTTNAEEARGAARDLWDSLTPLEQAQQKVTYWTNELSSRLAEYGPNSDQASTAQERMAYWSGELSNRQGELEQAINGVTTAMVEQANQALAATNSELGYQMAIDNLQGSQEAAAVAIRDFGAASEEASDAQLQLATDVIGAATAAGQMASDSLPANTSELQRNATATQGTLQELYRLRDTMGVEFPNAADNAIARLESAGVTLDATGAAANGVAQDMSALGLSVQAVPNEKFVKVDAPTADQKARLDGLGYTVTNLPDGDIYVSASPEDAEAAINYAARTRYTTIVATVVSKMLGGAKPYAETGSGGNPIGLPSVGGAIGGIVKPYALGGFQPMQGGIAQVVQPNTWRVIGDRVTDDEAYIPINASARSQEILGQTAERMGYSLSGREVSAPAWSSREVSGGAGAGGSGSVSVTSGPVHVYLDGQEWRGIARVESERVTTGALEQLYQRTIRN